MVDIHKLRLQFKEAARSRNRSKSFPEELVEQAVAYVIIERGKGVRWNRIAKEVGVSRTTLRHWVIRANKQPCTPSTGFSALTITEEPITRTVLAENPVVSARTLISPNRFKLTGCCLDELVQILKALG